MRIAPIPFNEELRLQDLYAFDILDSEKEKDFDDLLEMAAHIYDCPIAAITFIDKERQWLKSKIGLGDAVQEASRNVAFCAHTILENEVMVVKDASKDERFCKNPLVVGGPAIRFYAGAPIVSPSGYRLGSICVIDRKPRELSKPEAEMLQALSRQIAKLLELRLKNKVLLKKAEEQLQLKKMLLQKTLQAHESEKQTISTTLHENIAQSLAASKLYLEMAESGGVASKELLHKASENITAIVQQVRELSYTIRPSLLPEVDLKGLLTGLLRQFHIQTGIKTKLLYEGAEEVASSTALPLYRIIEAQLHNVQHHARATVLMVNIHVFSSIYLSVKDDGAGFDSKTFQPGAGLTKILSTAEELNGKVEISSRVKGGCELTVTFPR